MDAFRLNTKDKTLLIKYMEKHNIKNKSEAIRECIRISATKQEIDNYLFDIDNKINRLIFNQTLIKKLLEQLFVNMGFKKNIDVNESETLEDFKEKNNKFRNSFLG